MEHAYVVVFIKEKSGLLEVLERIMNFEPVFRDKTVVDKSTR